MIYHEAGNLSAQNGFRHKLLCAFRDGVTSGQCVRVSASFPPRARYEYPANARNIESAVLPRVKEAIRGREMENGKRCTLLELVY